MMFGICWAAAHNSYYLYLLIPCLFMLVYRLLCMRKQRQMLVADRYVSCMLYNYAWSVKVIKSFLIMIGIFFLLLALLRPQWGKQEQSVMQQGRDVMIALDISRSMLAKDLKPNRLQCAKEKIKKLLYNLSCERVGLIVFSSSAIVQCPLTTDYGAFSLLLDQLDIDTISSGSTAVDQSIQAALKAFSSIPERKTKLLVLFTDGEDFSVNLDGIKEKVLEDGLSIFTIGIGTQYGAPIPVLDKNNKQIGWEKDEKGDIIMSCLNDTLLASIALKSGGKYIHFSQNDDDIHKLIEFINSFEKDAMEDKTLQVFQEQYPYCIIISFICFALEWLL